MIASASKLDWTAAELDYLRQNYLVERTAYIAARLGRSEQAVRGTARRNGLAWRDVGRVVRGRRRG